MWRYISSCPLLSFFFPMAVLKNFSWHNAIQQIKIGPWGPELIWQMATKYKMSRQNWLDIYVCVFVYVKNMHVCLCISACVLMYVCVHVSASVCAGVSADVCACVCVSVNVYICGMPNIKFVSLAYMHVTKNAKCESGTTCVSVCVHLSVCMRIVYVVCQI